MKIALINPIRRKDRSRDFYDLDLTRKLFGVIATLPLWMPTLAALTPKGIEVKIIDENIEEIDYDEKFDLVGIGALTKNVLRAYEIAKEFKERGVKVVLGGIHASMLPEEASQFADAILIGEAEHVWGNLIEDFSKGELKPLYRAQGYPCLEDSPVPRFDLTKSSRYSLNSIQTTRGCPFDCDFCSVKSYLGPQFRMKKMEQIAQEIEACQKFYEIDIFGKKLKLKKGFFIVDDNIIGNRNYAINLFKTLKRFDVPKWWCQASINLGKDLELLSLMKEADCGKVFIGIESVEQKTLEGFGKKVNRIEDYERSIRTIQSFGIEVVASFILGADGDNDTTFGKTVDFINRNNIGLCLLNILFPLPGTRLFQKIETEKRLLHKDWNKYDAQHACHIPLGMSPQLLEEGFRWVNQEIYSPAAFAKRMKGFWREGKIAFNDYAGDYLSSSVMDLLLYPIPVFRLLLSSGKKGFQIALNLFVELIKGKGDLDSVIRALIYSNYAFSMPKSRFMDLKKIGHKI